MILSKYPIHIKLHNTDSITGFSGSILFSIIGFGCAIITIKKTIYLQIHITLFHYIYIKFRVEVDRQFHEK